MGGNIINMTTMLSKAVANSPVGQVLLAGPLFLKAKTKFHYTKASNKQKQFLDLFNCYITIE